MTEKIEKVYIAPVREFDNTRCLIYGVVNPLDRNEKFEIVWEVPQLSDGLEEAEAWCQERYDCGLQDLLTQGVRSFGTRPEYTKQGFIWEKGPDGKEVPVELKPNGHEEMQELADNYQVGRKASLGESQKAKAAKVDAINAQLAESGKSIDDIMAMAREMGIVD